MKLKLFPVAITSCYFVINQRSEKYDTARTIVCIIRRGYFIMTKYNNQYSLQSQSQPGLSPQQVSWIRDFFSLAELLSC